MAKKELGVEEKSSGDKAYISPSCHDYKRQIFKLP